MPWRVLNYVVRLCDDLLAKDKQRKTVPAVIPIVVHHGKRPWTASRDLHAVIDIDDALKSELSQYLPQFRFVLDDLSAQTDEDLRR